MNQIRSIISRTSETSTSDNRTLNLIQNQLDYSQTKSTFHHTDNKTTNSSQFRFVQIVDLQTNGFLPRDLTAEQQTLLQRLDLQVAKLPFDKQRQFVQTQRFFVPKYLSTSAQTSTVGPVKRSRSEIFDQQIRKEHSFILRPNTKRRFFTRRDAFEQLLPFHLFAQPTTTKNDCDKFDEIFEKEAKRLLKSSERLQKSIERIVLTNDRQMIDTNVYDQYLIEKIQLEDLRDEVESRKRQKSNSFESPNFHCEPVMSDEAYFDLFQS